MSKNLTTRSAAAICALAVAFVASTALAGSHSSGGQRETVASTGGGQSGTSANACVPRTKNGKPVGNCRGFKGTDEELQITGANK